MLLDVNYLSTTLQSFLYNYLYIRKTNTKLRYQNITYCIMMPKFTIMFHKLVSGKYTVEIDWCKTHLWAQTCLCRACAFDSTATCGCRALFVGI